MPDAKVWQHLHGKAKQRAAWWQGQYEHLQRTARQRFLQLPEQVPAEEGFAGILALRQCVQL